MPDDQVRDDKVAEDQAADVQATEDRTAGKWNGRGRAQADEEPRPARRPHPEGVARRHGDGARLPGRGGRHRALPDVQQRSLRRLSHREAGGRHVPGVGPLRRRRGVPAVPHQARRLQLLHPQPSGHDQHRPLRERSVSPAHHGLRRRRQLRPVPSEGRDREGPGLRQHPRQPHGLREAGYQCLTCHANISHPGTRLEAARVPNDKMAICARCHDGKQLPDDCGTCHVGGAPAEEIDVPIQGHLTGTGLQRVSQGEGLLLRVPSRPADAAPAELGARSRQGRARPRQVDLRLVPSQGRQALLRRLSRRADAPSVSVGEPARQRRREGHGGVRQVPRQEQLHRVPRPADASPRRLRPDAPVDLPRLPRDVFEVPQLVVLLELSRREPAAQQRVHRRTTRSTRPTTTSACAKCHGTSADGGANSCYGGECHSGSPDSGG